MNIPTIKQLSDSIIQEIKKDSKLMTCKSFSELHDFCDANMLGCSAEVLNSPDMGTSIHTLNEAQNLVDEWIKTKNV